MRTLLLTLTVLSGIAPSLLTQSSELVAQAKKPGHIMHQDIQKDYIKVRRG